MTAGRLEKLPSVRIREFEASIRRGCVRCGLKGWRGPLLAGFSGGADSAALLLSLSSIASGRGHWPFPLIAVHVNHGIRTTTAERDAAHAKSFCDDREIPFLRIDVDLKDFSGRGLEAAARGARRAAFLEAARSTGARAIALAHTMDDQAETILMHLFEGSGIRGLAGMRPRAYLQEEIAHKPNFSLEIFRPMLGVNRAENRVYLEALGAKWVEDETNIDERHLRNRIRLRLLPSLEKIFGEKVTNRIASSAEHLSSALEVVDYEIDKAKGQFFVEEKEGIRIDPLSEVAQIPQAVRIGLWEAALSGVSRDGDEYRKRVPLGRLLTMIDRIAFEGGPSASLNLPGGIEARRTYDEIYFGRSKGLSSIPDDEIPLSLPGITAHPGLRVLIKATSVDRIQEGGDGKTLVFVNAERLLKGAVLRVRRAGDRFHPRGGPGEKKLKDYFIDRKVALRDRNFIPLVAIGDEVVWIVGHSVSEKYISNANSGAGFALKAENWPETTDILSEMSEFG